MQNKVAVAAVTYNRPEEVKILLDSLAVQSHVPTSVVLVDSGSEAVGDIASSSAAPVTYVRSETNLGGAGGFSLAILTALASGADWVWIMDDDAHPEDANALAALLTAANERDLDVISPLIVAPDEPQKLSFPLRLGGHLIHDRAEVEPMAFIPNIASFFNGALIRSEVFFKIGLPDLRLFIRGDEVDFMLRLRAAKVPFGTLTTVAVTHPPGWSEVKYILGDRMHVLVPETAFKQFYFYRNRGQLTRKYRRIKSLVADLTGYPIYFCRTRDMRGLVKWARTYAAGFRGQAFGHPEKQSH